MASQDVVPLRNAVVGRLEDNPLITAALGDGSVWGEQQPADAPWPFIRYGAPIVTPDQVGQLTGGRHRVTVHVFARGPSMDECAALCTLVEDELDEQDIDLVFPVASTREATVWEMLLNSCQIIPDGPDDWHGVMEFDTSVAGA